MTQIEQAQAIVPKGTPGDYVPTSIQEPLRRALAEEIPVDTELVHQLMDHNTMEQLFHDVLSSVLLDFTETIKTWTQTATSMTSTMRPKGMGGFGRLKAFGEKALQNSPLGQIGQNHRATGAAKDFAVLRSVHCQYYSSFCDRDWEAGKSCTTGIVSTSCTRCTVVYRQSAINGTVHCLFEPRFIVETVTQTTQAILDLPSFQDQLGDVLKQLLETVGDQSVHDFLVDSDLGDDWRTEVEDYVVSMAHQIVQQPKVSEISPRCCQPKVDFQR